MCTKTQQLWTLQTKMIRGYNELISKVYYCQIKDLDFNLYLYQKLNKVYYCQIKDLDFNLYLYQKLNSVLIGW